MSIAETPATGEQALPLATLQHRCDAIERDLLFSKRVAAGALESMKPGGAENPDAEASGWLTYLLHLVRLHANGGSSAAPKSVVDDRELEDAITDSLANKAEPVRFDDGEVRAVYPKSFHVLRFLDQLDAMLRITATMVLADGDLDRAEGVEVRVRALALESRAVLVWLWILTHPGCGIPFDVSSPDPKPPKWTLRATPEDLMRVAEAHLRVHCQRNGIIAAAFPPDPSTSKSRLPLSGFIGAMAQESGHKASDLMRHWSLGEIMAQSAMAARAAKEAEDRAKKSKPPEAE